MVTAKNKNKTVNNSKWYAGCVAHVVIGVVYSVVDNRWQPNLYIYEVYVP